MTFFDRAARFALVDCKIGHVLWGVACGAFIGAEISTIVHAVMLIGGLAGMISSEVYARSDRSPAGRK